MKPWTSAFGPLHTEDLPTSHIAIKDTIQFQASRFIKFRITLLNTPGRVPIAPVIDPPPFAYQQAHLLTAVNPGYGVVENWSLWAEMFIAIKPRAVNDYGQYGFILFALCNKPTSTTSYSIILPNAVSYGRVPHSKKARTQTCMSGLRAHLGARSLPCQ